MSQDVEHLGRARRDKRGKGTNGTQTTCSHHTSVLAAKEMSPGAPGAPEGAPVISNYWSSLL